MPERKAVEINFTLMFETNLYHEINFIPRINIVKLGQASSSQ